MYLSAITSHQTVYAKMSVLALKERHQPIETTNRCLVMKKAAKWDSIRHRIRGHNRQTQKEPGFR